MSRVKRIPFSRDGQIRFRLAKILKNMGFYAPFKNSDSVEAEGRKYDIIVFLEAKDGYLFISGKDCDVKLVVSLMESDSSIARYIKYDFMPIYRQNFAINNNHNFSTEKPENAKFGFFKGCRRGNI